ncbi:MAG: class I ribonucleotide reductase maintenance protein YfaE [Neisseria sp.]|nr:class I ribonucleotide reductase maintenance protein YfaE [Neisseria sp.]
MHPITTNDRIFTLQNGETLLEGLERTGHEVEYQCRSGYCGACRLKILKGRVEYPVFPLAFTAPGEILPCCCRIVEPVTLDCNCRLYEPDLFDEDLFDKSDSGSE